MLSETGVGVGGGPGSVMLRCSRSWDESLQPHLHPPARAGEGEEKVSKRWYILVIVLLYVGLIISFCLNLALLLRRHPPIPQPDCQVPGLHCSQRPPPPPTSHLNTLPGGQASFTRHALRCSTVLVLTNIFTVLTTPRLANK